MKKIDRRLFGVYTYFAKKESDRVELLYPQLDMRPRMVKAPGIIAKAMDEPVARNAIIVGSIGYSVISTAILLKTSKRKLPTALNILGAAALPAAISGISTALIDKAKLFEDKSRLLNECTARYNKLSALTAEGISDDPRLTKSVMKHFRDLRYVIKELREDLHYNGSCDDLDSLRGEKSKKQAMEAICASFGDIHAEYVEDLRRSKIIGTLGDQIIVDVRDAEALERVKAETEHIGELFREFGLVPLFMASSDFGEALSDMML